MNRHKFAPNLGALDDGGELIRKLRVALAAVFAPHRVALQHLFAGTLKPIRARHGKIHNAVIVLGRPPTPLAVMRNLVAWRKRS